MSTNTPRREARIRPLEQAMDHLNRAVDDLFWYMRTPPGQRDARRLLASSNAALQAIHVIEGNMPLAAWLPTDDHHNPAGSPVRAEADGAD